MGWDTGAMMEDAINLKAQTESTRNIGTETGFSLHAFLTLLPVQLDALKNPPKKSNLNSNLQ